MDASAWNARYLAQPDAWGTTPAARIVAEVTAAEDAGLGVGTAVDLACGDGRHARWLAAHGWRVQAVDFSEVAIEQARAKDSDEGRSGSVDWVVGDARTWSPAEPVDLVVVGFLHLDLPELDAVLRDAGTWLRPGGHLVYLGHAAENLRRGVGGPQDPAVLFSGQDIEGDLQDHLRSGTLVLERSGRAAREVETEEGPVVAWDALFRAKRRPDVAGGFSFGS